MTGQTGADDVTLTSYRPVLLAALASAFGLTLAIAGWSMFAKLDAAIVTNGILHAESDRKTVVHLEGGILAEILVRPGDFVEVGQVVARLDDTQISETLVQLETEYEHRRLTRWRLKAEQDGQRPDPQTLQISDRAPFADQSAQIAASLAFYKARLHSHEATLSALDGQIAQRQAQIVANESLSRSAAAQLLSWEREHDSVGRLVQTGAAPERRLWELDRSIAINEGTRDENDSLIEAARQDIVRARSEKEALVQTRLVEIAAELAETNRVLLSLDSQIRAAQDVRARHLMRAPQSGRVVEITVNTPGAVLRPGEVLMEILPAADALVALIRLAPNSIDTVKTGGPARVRMIAYKRIDAPIVDGILSFVSPDALEDAATQIPYFEARITLDPDDLAAISETPISAGMPVEVTLIVGSRRAGDYLLEPLFRHFRRALREE